MTKIEALELELAARKMVEGTTLKWDECLRHMSLQSTPLPLEFYDARNIELAIGIVEGKPLWNGDTYFHNGIEMRARVPMEKWFYSECTLNQPKPKTEKADRLRELLATPYFRGVYNGMEVMLACVEERRAELIGKPKPKTVMVELTVEDVEYYANERNLTIAEIEDIINRRTFACIKALKELK